MATITVSIGCQSITWTIATLLLLLNHLTISQDHQGQCSTLYLLNVQPYPVTNEFGDHWDKAFELIPAGHLATEQINRRSDILPGHKLKLIDIDSEACGIMNIISKGITNIYRELVNSNRTCIVGIIGLFVLR